MCWASLLCSYLQSMLWSITFSCSRLQEPGFGSLSMLCTGTQEIHVYISISLVQNNRSHVRYLVTHRCLRRRTARMRCGNA